MNAIRIMKQHLSDLCNDIDSFCDVYAEDADVWQGEAATEEACYITSDIDEFRETAADMEKHLERLAETAGGEEQ